MRQLSPWETLSFVKDLAKDRLLHLVRSEDVGSLIRVNRDVILPIRTPFLAIFDNPSDGKLLIQMSLILLNGILFIQVDIEDMRYLMVFPPRVCLKVVRAIERGAKYILFSTREWDRGMLRGLFLETEKLSALRLVYLNVKYENVARLWEFLKGVLWHEDEPF